MHIYLVYGAMLSVTLVASVTDVRSGLIPNWLTLPTLLLGPLIEASFGGLRGFLLSLLGILVAGAVPLLFHRLGAMGGGDVKLFAALGGLGGPRLGLEIELLALACAFFWGIAMLAYRGHLARALANSGRLLINLVLPAKHQRPVASEQLTSLRIGSAIFAGTLIAVINHAWFGGLLT
jgi:prepilin peptidase CpaA